MSPRHASSKRLPSVLVLLVASLALVGCSPSAAPIPPTPDAQIEPPPGPTFGDASLDDPLSDRDDASVAIRILRVVGQHCVGGPESPCHGAGAGGTHLDLDPVSGDVVGIPSRERPDLVRAQPGSPEQSYVWLKLVGDGGIEGGAMPPTIGPRDPRVEALFRRWIAEGCRAP